MRTLADEIAEDAEMNVPSEEKLSVLGKLIKEQLQLEAKILEVTGYLTNLQAQHHKVSEEHIPNLFLELGLSAFKLEDGSEVVVKPYYNATITEEHQVEAFAWLRGHNLDDIIKHEVKVIFGKGEDEACGELKKTLADLNVNYVDKESVHPQTLKALVKERVEKLGDRLDETEKIPFETFSVYIGRKTKIVQPKKRK